MGAILMILGVLFLVLVVVVISITFLFTSLAKQIGERRKEKGVKIASGTLEPDFFDDLSELPIIGTLFGQQLASSKDAALYCNSAIPQILQEWNTEELRNRSTDHLLSSFEAGELEANFASHSENLGQLITYKGIKNAHLGNYFTTEAIFSKGLAHITIELAQYEDSWSIDKFRVNYIFPEQGTAEETSKAQPIQP